jgi:uncharacterized protein YfdQ (DUF2303 family)
MAASAPVTATVEHVGGEIHNTPHPAQLVADGQGLFPYTKILSAVTEEQGLEVKTIVDDETLYPTPWRAKGERVVSDLSSFLAELQRRPLGADSTLWGNADRGTLVAIYNDHGATDGDPGWRDDKLKLQLVPDADWVAWHALSGKAFKQTEFGDKIEELLHTIVDPDQADVLEIIDSIRASSKGTFESSIVRANGGQTLTYNQEITASAGHTGQLQVPQIIKANLRPWEGHHETYDVEGYFRLRVENGTLLLSIKLKPTRQIVRQAWDEITTTVTSAVNTPVYAQP